jgi:hypothetical protein
MKKQSLFLLLPALLFAIVSCKKSTDVSQAQIQVGQPISDATPLSGAVKGTMQTSKTYTISADVTINKGDTMLIQEGVTVKVLNGAKIVVNGTFISLGTQANPITITDPSRTKTTGTSTASSDSAYAGGWGGIWCSPDCKLFVCKWTHLDFAGAGLQTIPFTGSNAPAIGDQYAVYFGNPDGVFIFEDSWVYGTPDDCFRFYGGHVNIMRNTFEKCGGTGGDGCNAKSGTQGNMAYNLCVGGATNMTKSANDGGVNPQCRIAMYNNTYVNCGYRQVKAFGARGGSIEVENNSRALVYNNLIVDCRFGYRIAGGTNTTAKVYQADTDNHAGDNLIPYTMYGYNFTYVDDSALASQIVPTNVAQAVVTKPQSTDIPDMKDFLPSTYQFGDQYNGNSFIGKNNPQFKNYPLPNLNYATQASVDNFDFHLSSGSPAIGKGYEGFTPVTNGIPLDPNFGSTEITSPGKDMGCFQTNGTGNKH